MAVAPIYVGNTEKWEYQERQNGVLVDISLWTVKMALIRPAGTTAAIITLSAVGGDTTLQRGTNAAGDIDVSGQWRTEFWRSDGSDEKFVGGFNFTVLPAPFDPS